MWVSSRKMPQLSHTESMPSLTGSAGSGIGHNGGGGGVVGMSHMRSSKGGKGGLSGTSGAETSTISADLSRAPHAVPAGTMTLDDYLVTGPSASRKMKGSYSASRLSGGSSLSKSSSSQKYPSLGY